MQMLGTAHVIISACPDGLRSHDGRTLHKLVYGTALVEGIATLRTGDSDGSAEVGFIAETVSMIALRFAYRFGSVLKPPKGVQDPRGGWEC